MREGCAIKFHKTDGVFNDLTFPQDKEIGKLELNQSLCMLVCAHNDSLCRH